MPLVSVSGGVDTAVVLARAIDLFPETTAAVYILHSSKNQHYERAAFAALADYYSVKSYFLQAFDIFSYCDASILEKRGNIVHGASSSNTIPNRNTVFAALLASMAESIGYGVVWLGTHKGAFDADSSSNWYAHTSQAIWEGSGGKTNIYCPLISYTKSQVVKIGLEIKVPFGLTRSCYSNNPIACGMCGACQSRLQAFQDNGVEDPIEYVTRELLPQETKE